MHLHVRWRRETRHLDSAATPRWSLYCQLEMSTAEGKRVAELNLWDRTIGAVAGVCAGGSVQRLARREWLLCPDVDESQRAALEDRLRADVAELGRLLRQPPAGGGA